MSSRCQKFRSLEVLFLQYNTLKIIFNPKCFIRNSSTWKSVVEVCSWIHVGYNELWWWQTVEQNNEIPWTALSLCTNTPPNTLRPGLPRRWKAGKKQLSKALWFKLFDRRGLENTSQSQQFVKQNCPLGIWQGRLTRQTMWWNIKQQERRRWNGCLQEIIWFLWN